MKYLLDTDHISYLEWAESAKAIKLSERLTAAQDNVSVTIISFEEQMRGWLPKVKEPTSMKEQIDGYRLSRAAVETQLERLASLPLAERRELPGLDPDRAPVIVAGAVIVDEVMKRYDLDELEVSERDLLHGAALEAAQLPEPQEGDAPPGAYTCC